MKDEITFRDGFDDRIKYCEDIEIPDECPICHKGIIPYVIDAYYLEGSLEPNKVLINCICPSCDNLYAISAYKNDIFHQLCNCTFTPNTFKGKTFNPETKNISTQFIEIYKQAEQAEYIGLDKIAGMAYRKSIEFLVKDFLRYKYPEKESRILNELLGKCIQDFIDR